MEQIAPPLIIRSRANVPASYPVNIANMVFSALQILVSMEAAAKKGPKVHFVNAITTQEKDARTTSMSAKQIPVKMEDLVRIP